jgi:hypothetical protein
MSERTDIITKLQERIENIEQELVRLTEDKEFYQQIILELTSDDDYDNISLQSVEYFVEERKARSSNNNVKPSASKKNSKKLERQIALEKAWAWSINRKKERERGIKHRRKITRMQEMETKNKIKDSWVEMWAYKERPLR